MVWFGFVFLNLLLRLAGGWALAGVLRQAAPGALQLTVGGTYLSYGLLSLISLPGWCCVYQLCMTLGQVP